MLDVVSPRLGVEELPHLGRVKIFVAVTDSHTICTSTSRVSAVVIGGRFLQKVFGAAAIGKTRIIVGES